MTNVAFLDLNGTLVMPVLVDRLEELQPIPGAAAAVARLCAHGFRCPVVTIQSRIAKGFFTEGQFLAWFRTFADAFKSRGAVLEGPYVCPHRFAALCPCKKPSTLLYERAASDRGLQLAGAFVVGDSAADMEAAERLGGVGCLVRTGWAEGDAEMARARRHARFVGQSLPEVADWILAQSAAEHAHEAASASKSRDSISREESYVLAVEGLEREVNNGGYSQFFINSSNEFALLIEAALRAIDCPKTADITRDAIAALRVEMVTAESVAAAALSDDESIQAALAACDDRYFANDEPIADCLFRWIAANKHRVRVGGA